MKARIDLRISRTSLKQWRAASRSAGLTLSEWMRRICNGAALPQEAINILAANAKSRRRR